MLNVKTICVCLLGKKINLVLIFLFHQNRPCAIFTFNLIFANLSTKFNKKKSCKNVHKFINSIKKLYKNRFDQRTN